MRNNTFVDCHVHCNYSDDSVAQADDEVKYAHEIGLKGITFTDHYDLDYPNPKYHFAFNVVERRQELAELSDRYQDKISVYNGIEIGIQPHVVKQSLEIVQHGHFDFVICSTHAVDGFSLCSQSGFFEGKTKEQAYRRYLEEIYAAITNFTDYDIVGHIGYVRRYGPYAQRSMPYKQYQDILDMILKKVIELGKGIEINTSGFFYKLGTPIPELDLLKRYKQLGGEIITIGSDAHKVEHIGDSFDTGVEMLKQAGFAYVAHFDNRQPVFELL
jgi:histidinol-phosphatase (PHP family)